MRHYASPRDRLAEIRTKVPNEIYDEIEATAYRLDLTMYETVRTLLIWALNNHPMRSIGTGTQNPGPVQDFGKDLQVLPDTHTDGTSRHEAAPAAPNGRDTPA